MYNFFKVDHDSIQPYLGLYIHLWKPQNEFEAFSYTNEYF